MQPDLAWMAAFAAMTHGSRRDSFVRCATLVNSHRDREEAAEAGAATTSGGAIQAIAWEARKEPADGNPAFNAGNVEPHAEMHA